MRRGEFNTWWRIGVPIVAPLVRLVFRVRVSGLEHVPLQGGAILVFNHQSPLDGPVLAAEIGRRLRRESRFLVAAEFFRRPFQGWILTRFEQIPIRRGEGDAAALEGAIETVRQGALAAMAPEGAVNPVPETLMRIRSGVARIALPSGAPIVPVGIWGTHRRWPRAGLRLPPPWRPRLALVVGDPVLPFGDSESESDVNELVSRVESHLQDAVARARRLAGPEP